MKRYGAAALVMVLLLAGTWLYVRRDAQGEVAHPRRGDITEAVYGLGKVKSNHKFEVIVGVVSTVTRLFVQEGDQVRKNAPLIEFESSALIRSPFPGAVTYIRAYEQETVVPQVPVLRVEDLNDLFIELSLEQEGAIKVKKGMPAKVSFESTRGKILDGTVTALFPREDEFLAQVRVSGLESSVLPGMTADVTIEVGKIRNAILIPLRAVQNGMVAVRRNGKWRKEKLDIGRVDGLYAEVKGDALTTEDEIRLPKAED